jgi:hypothetical protein
MGHGRGKWDADPGKTARAGVHAEKSADFFLIYLMNEIETFVLNRV